jgi:ABC-2 type transport system permease protein
MATMLRNSFTKWLWDHRRSILGWTAALAGLGGMYAAFWTTIDNPAMREALANYPEEIMEALNYTDIATAAGYLNATVYGLVVGILLTVYAISAGTKTIAGDEELGTLDLILAHPISRARLALQRFGAVATTIVIMSVGLLLVLLIIQGPAQLEGISIGDFAAMHIHLLLFGVLYAAVAYAVGAATGRKSLAVGVGAGVVVFGFAANGILNQVDGMEWIEDFSPFEWLNGGTPLESGVQWLDASVMIGLSLLLVAAGTWAFTRRDVAV